MMRRGVVVTVALPPNGASFSRSVFCAASCIHAGISSVSSSKKYSAIRDLQERKSERLARLEVLLRATDGEIADAFDHGAALRAGDRAARVEGVEDMGALERPGVRGPHELLFETLLRLTLVDLE